MRNSLMIVWAALVLPAAAAAQTTTSYSAAPFSPAPAQYVDPMIGTANFGATHPGAQYPHALLSVSPFNVAWGGKQNAFDKDAAWNSRVYIKENQFLTGFSHVNLSGVGCPDLGVLLAMPTTGALQLDPAKYGSTYQQERANAGYYATTLSKYQTRAEMTSTQRTGISRYTFPAGQAHILLNLGLGLSNESGGMAKLVSDTEVEGYRQIGTFCYHSEQARPVYFVARVNKAPKVAGLYKKMPAVRAVEADWSSHNASYKPYPNYRQELAGDDIGAYFSYEVQQGEQLELQLAISFVSIANARQNLLQEQPQFAFDATRNNARAAWDQLLSRIDIDASTEDKIRFYTALYHSLIHPSVISDINGDYPKFGPAGSGTGKSKDPRYSVFSLWDTHRNLHPLLSLVYPAIQTQMLRSIVAMGTEAGYLPKWELAGMEKAVMVGDPATVMVNDSYQRGLTDFDSAAAYQAMRRAALTPSSISKPDFSAKPGQQQAARMQAQNPIRPENSDYLALGYVPVDDEGPFDGSVSTSLEYYLADFNLAAFAKALGHNADASRFAAQAQLFSRLFDTQTGMFRPKQKNGQWLSHFNPDGGRNFEPTSGYIEGTAWNYRFYLPHAIPQLMTLNGGPDAFRAALDQMFTLKKFDMANEPDISYPFLYNYLEAKRPGSRAATSQRVAQLIQQHYGLSAAGLPGNDDAGTLSAWLVFSMLGLYPTEPGTPNYTLFQPRVKAARIALDPAFYPGKMLEIKQKNSGKLLWNQQALPTPFVSHQALVQGGVLELSAKD
jgi:predicted alpha-1,2-mannosidase